MTQSFIADVVVKHEALPLTPTIWKVPEVGIRVESQPTHRESPSLFYSVTDSDFREFEAALDDDPTVDDWSLSLEFDDCRIYQIEPSREAKFTTPKVAELGIRILSIQRMGRGWYFQLQAPNKEVLGDYWRYCREEDVEFDLQKIYRSGPQETVAASGGLEAHLTERQLEVARTVTRMGYYKEGGASAEAVAAELGISPSTLSTHLRRITVKLFDLMFKDD